MDLFIKFVSAILSEYGGFVAFLVITNGTLAFAIRILWNRVKELTDAMVQIVRESTTIMTKINEKLEAHDHYDSK